MMMEQAQLFARMGDSAEAAAVRQRLQAQSLRADMSAFKVPHHCTPYTPAPALRTYSAAPALTDVVVTATYRQRTREPFSRTSCGGTHPRTGSRGSQRVRQATPLPTQAPALLCQAWSVTSLGPLLGA